MDVVLISMSANSPHVGVGRSVLSEAGGSRTREERQLAVLEQTYPAWQIVQDPDGGWCATRRIPTVGALGSICRPDAESLASALALQVHLRSVSRREDRQ